MYPNPFDISCDVLIGTSCALGHRLEDRAPVRNAQNADIVRYVQESSTVRLRDHSQRNLFCVAPIDVLVTEDNGQVQFHLIELNGTGIGGLTNISADAVGATLEGLLEMAEQLEEPNPLVLVASSGMESEQLPRLNKTIYEKILYVEAMHRGFSKRGQAAVANTVVQLREAPWEIATGKPTIVLGYMKQFLRWLKLHDDGRLTLFNRQVDAVVNDRFCLNVLHEFPTVDLKRLRTMNRCFVAGADKAVFYELLNDYLRRNPTPISRPVQYTLAHTREELVAKVMQMVRDGQKVVIKPQGTGLGHGIEFFLSSRESDEQITARIDGSLQLTERYYGLHGGALPYTVSEFFDTKTIKREGHPLNGHKFELRMVVYRCGDELRAFPSIVKIASEIYNPLQPSYLSLINNITASAVAKQSAGVDYMLPLSHSQTLELLGLSLEDVAALAGLCTGVVRFILDQTQDAPQRLGLPT
ncbi:MAG: hypothetical protein KatS3mg105_2972 [Gemmatales bacterium]|nr:MAG: hypothetical protein KatS3mg105_2972 [Gemmatales bacterium]